MIATSHQSLSGLRIERRVCGKVIVLAARGELDAASCPELREALREAIDARQSQRVIVDLDGTDFIDSAGTSVLLGGLKRARDNDGDLVLVVTGRNVLKVLDVTGLTRIFDVHASLESALRVSA